MKRNTYIKHDSNARNDERMLALRRQYGMEGYGVYWALIEKLRESTDYKLPTDYSAIAWELHVSANVIEHIVGMNELFGVDGDFFYSLWLNDEMKVVDEQREKRSAAGKLGMKSRWGNAENQPSQAPQTELPLSSPITPPNEPPQPPKSRPKKYSDAETQLHSRCKEIFTAYYHQNKGTDFYWSAKEMSAIVGILKQIKFQMAEADRDNLELVGTNFQAFIQMIFAKADDWIKANISPTLIHSKFNEIYTQLKNSTRNGNKQSSANSGNARDNIEFITRIAATLQSGGNK